MSATKLFNHYHQELVATLPMKNETFLAELRKNNLLHEDVSRILESYTTSAERALYFLDNVIKPEKSNKYFDRLLNIMKDSKEKNTKDLSKSIKSKLIKSI